MAEAASLKQTLECKIYVRWIKGRNENKIPFIEKWKQQVAKFRWSNQWYEMGYESRNINRIEDTTNVNESCNKKFFVIERVVYISDKSKTAFDGAHIFPKSEKVGH